MAKREGEDREEKPAEGHTQQVAESARPPADLEE